MPRTSLKVTDKSLSSSDAGFSLFSEKTHKMKHILFVILLAATFLACKKTRTCNCTITRAGVITRANASEGLSLPAIPGLPTIPSIGGASDTTNEDYKIITTEISTFDKVSKKDMHAACPKTKEEVIYDRQVMSAAGLFTATTTDSGKKTTECTIE
jgi:hypothetical protein